MSYADASATALTRDEQRRCARLQCDIEAYGKGRAPLGTIRNIALEGCFLETTEAIPASANQTLVFAAGHFGRVIAEAEVVRTSPAGVGMRFTQLAGGAQRRLRRLVAELNAIEGHRHEAASLQEGPGHTIADRQRIGALLEQARQQKAAFTIIPALRNEKISAVMESHHNGALNLQHGARTEFTEHEDAFALFTLGFDSYSFRTRVLGANGENLQVQTPPLLSFSERRAVARTKADHQALLCMQVPWQAEPAEWPVYDVSPGGFSIRVSAGNALFLPGTPLESARLLSGDNAMVLPKAIVKHITHVREEDGGQWWKVGISKGVDRTETRITSERVRPERRGALALLKRWLLSLTDLAAYLYHSRFKRLRAIETDEPFQVVRLKNKRGRNLVGLLNTSFPSTRVRAPLVIVVPGFGSRKEAMSALAQTLTHNFKRHDKDIAVLRFDGVNNLGESDKDAGLHQDGKNTFHYTVSDGIDDLLGAIEWANNNPYVDATDIILVSVSFSSVSVRSALTRPEASSVGRWIVYMGAADAQNSIMNVSGNIDAWGNYVRGIANGTVTLQGCMVDGDRFCRDLDEQHAATLEDARRDLANIDVPITWLIGKHDAWMDPGRIHDIMSVKAPNAREIVEVDTGHTPTSSDEALAQFQLIARLCWSHLYGENFDAVVPPRGWLAAVAEQEWSRVRSTDGIHNEQYWESYLLSDDKLGYDLLRYVPAYREFAAIQALEARPSGAAVLELGAGTGIVVDPILQEGPKKLTCVDIVEPVLHRLEKRLCDHLELGVVKADADGNPRTAMRRWLNGEFRSVFDLAGRIPAVNQPFLESLAGCPTESLHALLRGAPMDVREVRIEAGLPASMEPLLYDFNLMARVELGLVSPEDAIESAKRVPPSVFAAQPGLPFPTQSYDAIVASLLVSYLEYPADCLSECFRILRPGGRLVVSSMKPDADTSVIYREFLETLETSSSHELPYEKQDMLAAARGLLNKAAEVIRHEQEGFFCFYSEEQLTALVRKAGFGHVRVRYAYGSPAQAIIVSCRKPRPLS